MNQGLAKRPALLLEAALILLLLAVSCKGDKNPSLNYSAYGLNTPVNSIRVEPSGSLAESPNSNFEILFNKDGLVSEYRHYMRNNSGYTKETYEYDRKGRLHTMRYYDADGSESGFKEFEYDGRFISSSTMFGMNSQQIYQWKNENDGCNITRSSYYDEGVLSCISHNRYDGNSREETVLGANGDTIIVNRYDYYDLELNRISTIDNAQEKIAVEYNEQGLPCCAENTLVDAAFNFYWNSSAQENVPVFYEYEYDDKGNWIIRKEFFGEGRAPGEILKRTINY